MKMIAAHAHREVVSVNGNPAEKGRTTMKALLKPLAVAALLAATAIPVHAHVDAVVCTVEDPTGTPLNVRNRPNGTLVGALHNDADVLVTQNAIVNGKVWSKVVPIGAGKEGWVFYNFLSCSHPSR